MIVCAIICAFVASLQVISAIYFENPIVIVLLGIVYLVTLFFAIDREASLLHRIYILEEKEKLKKYESEATE